MGEGDESSRLKEAKLSEFELRGRWSQLGVPHKGWTCVAMEDVGDDLVICEMCGFAEVRYVHVMTHEAWSEELRVGYVCASHMEQDYVGVKEREARFHSYIGRRGRWLTRQWRRSSKGNEFLKCRWLQHCRLAEARWQLGRSDREVGARSL
jgi:hypothetical protein